MREINGQTLGPIEVTEDSVLYGQITDGVTVSENTTFQVCGQITGDLTALHGANVIISGMVNGTIKTWAERYQFPELSTTTSIFTKMLKQRNFPTALSEPGKNNFGNKNTQRIIFCIFQTSIGISVIAATP